MTRRELRALGRRIGERHCATLELVDELDSASSEVESVDTVSDALAEALFMRAFTAYEQDVEALFFHYVTGGASVGGQRARTYLRTRDVAIAKRLAHGSQKFLSWSRPQQIRETAERYIENGWPIIDAMNAGSHVLADCERIRNRIAHRSSHSQLQFDAVQRNLFGTERVFPMTPGQLLRVRSKSGPELCASWYMRTMVETLQQIVDP